MKFPETIVGGRSEQFFTEFGKLKNPKIGISQN